MSIAFQGTSFQSSGFQETASIVAPAFQNTAFQSLAGQIAFQTNAFTPTTTPVTTGGGAGFVSHSYSRKRHDEFMALLRAEREALDRADELQNKTQKKALVAAVEKAKAVAEEAPAENIEELTLAIRHAAEARTAAVIARSNELRALAIAIARQIEEDEEEFLLLS